MKGSPLSLISLQNTHSLLRVIILAPFHLCSVPKKLDNFNRQDSLWSHTMEVLKVKMIIGNQPVTLVMNNYIYIYIYIYI